MWGPELAKLVLEVVGALALCGATVALLRSRLGRRVEPRVAAACVLAVLTMLAILVNVRTTGDVLNAARRQAVGSRAGLQHCFFENNSEPGARRPLRLAFLGWVKQRLPAHAVYRLIPSAGAPDASCVALVLLPLLPARAGEPARWTITFGRTPPDLQARIAEHDPSVRVFAPGFVLAQDSIR